MALLWFDGFDGYTFVTEAAPAYTAFPSSGGSFSPAGGRFGGGALSGGSTVQYRHSAAVTTMIVGAAFKFPAPLTANYIFRFYDSSGNEHGAIRVISDGSLVFVRGSNSTTAIVTSTLKLKFFLWNFIECRWTPDDVTGRVVVRVNGEVFIDFTGDSRNAGSANLQACSFVAPGGSFFDDIYLLDDTGPRLNDFLGDLRISSLPANATVSGTTTVIGAATRHEAIDEASNDSDATYVEGVSGNIDLYGITDIASDAVIHAAKALVIARKDDAGSRNIKVGVKSDTVVSESAAQLLFTDYIGLYHLTTDDPNTSAQWTASNLNAAQLKIEVV